MDDVQLIISHLIASIREESDVTITIGYNHRITNIFRGGCILLLNLQRVVDLDDVVSELKRRRITFVVSKVYEEIYMADYDLPLLGSGLKEVTIKVGHSQHTMEILN